MSGGCSLEGRYHKLNNLGKVRRSHIPIPEEEWTIHRYIVTLTSKTTRTLISAHRSSQSHVVISMGRKMKIYQIVILF